MRCVAYCRVSTEEGEQLNSLQNQTEYYAELFQQDGYNPASCGIFYRKNGTVKYLNNGIFADQGISGTKAYNREAFRQMMACARLKMFDMVYCKNVQRFSRNVAEGAAALKELKQHGVNVFFQDNGLDYFNNEDTINILLSISASESRQKSSAVKFGHRKAQERGKWTSGIPYGFNKKDGFLEINPEEAEVVREIYNLFLDGWGRTKIMRYLNSNGIKSRGYLWYQGHLRNILTNPVYCGVQVSHKSENKDVNVKLIEQIDPENYIVYERPEIAIIDKQTFNQVQAMITKKAEDYTESIAEGKKARRESQKHLFSNILICGNCGSTMRAKTRRSTRKGKTVYLPGEKEYVCTRNDSHGNQQCEYRNATPEVDLIAYVQKEVEDLRINNSAKLHRLFDDYINNYYLINTADRIQSISTKLDEIKSIQDNKIRLNTMDKNIVSDKELVESSKVYRKEVNELEMEKQRLQNIDQEVVKAQNDFEKFIKFIEKVDFDALNNLIIKKIFKFIQVTTTDITNRHQFRHLPKIEGVEYKAMGRLLVKSISCSVNILDNDSSGVIIDSIVKNTPTNDEIKDMVLKIKSGKIMIE